MVNCELPLAFTSWPSVGADTVTTGAPPDGFVGAVVDDDEPDDVPEDGAVPPPLTFTVLYHQPLPGGVQ